MYGTGATIVEFDTLYIDLLSNSAWGQEEGTRLELCHSEPCHWCQRTECPPQLSLFWKVSNEIGMFEYNQKILIVLTFESQ